jgi:two-component system chemotaxis response regulator CheY
MSTVLVCDDDADFRRFVRIALTRAGHQISEASNGASLLAQARAARPDVVLLDYDLGGPSGLEVAKALHALPGCETLPVLLLTADAPSDLTGVQAVLFKPVDPDALVQAVSRVVQL